MASISTAVRRVKDELPGQISEALVSQACQAAGYRWRRRVLTPVATLQLFVLQVLQGNVACRAVRRLSGWAFTAAGYCEARMRLPIDVFGHVATALTRAARRRVTHFGRWKGHRVMHIDGTGLSMPDEPALQEAFGYPGNQKPGCGFPVMHVLWLFDAATGLIVDFITDKWNTHDMAHAGKLHAAMEAGDVLVGDRAFSSFVHLALLLQANLHGVFRGHQRQIVTFTPGRQPPPRSRRRRRRGTPSSRWIRTLGPEDQIVEYPKPAKGPRWMSRADYAALPEAIAVRELRYTIASRGFRTRAVTLVTTLTDPRKYARSELAQLYKARWEIETNLRHLKQTMGMDVLRCKTVAGVRKELWVYLIVYNQVRQCMLDAAERQGVPPDRISFIDALDALRHHGQTATALGVIVVNPLRPGRHEPRVLKRRKGRYRYLTKPRDQLRQTLGIPPVVA